MDVQLTGKFGRFLHLYVRALREHLKPGQTTHLKPALRMGQEAVELGLRVRELASLHQEALARLKLSGSTAVWRKRANRFFTAAQGVIESAQLPIHQGNQEIKVSNQPVRRRRPTAVSAASKKKADRRKRTTSETPHLNHSISYPKLLAESLRVQKRLRRSAHETFLIQETQRGVLSRHLQDEIAQTLLSIQVRLLNLRTTSRQNQSTLTKEIAKAQQLVKQSARSIKRFARELALEPPGSGI